MRLAVGWMHACALDAEGVAYCWGVTEDSDLGTGTAGRVQRVPALVRTPLRFSAIRPGLTLTCGVTRGDAVVARWGGNGNGQLGRGFISSEPSGTPQRLVVRAVP